MIVLLKTLLLAVFMAIAAQDLKERKVYWILFPLMGLLLGSIQYQYVNAQQLLIHVVLNCLLVSGILAFLWAYHRYIKKQQFLNVSLGLGDALFLYAFAMGFPTVSFVVLLASCLCFSVLAFVVLNYFVNAKTVPLAGFMSLFLAVMIIIDHFTPSIGLFYL